MLFLAMEKVEKIPTWLTISSIINNIVIGTRTSNNRSSNRRVSNRTLLAPLAWIGNYTWVLAGLLDTRHLG